MSTQSPRCRAGILKGVPGDPLVSVVTPVYNMAAYVREAVESVLCQDYSRLEFIVMDGGSTDGTLDILDQYKGRLRYYSSPDGGAADAINRGFALANGSVLAWLNADDTYLPGAVGAAVQRLVAQPDALAVSGQGYWVSRSSRQLAPYPSEQPDLARLQVDCCICQPACFFRREAYLEVGGLDSTLTSAFDYDLWIRMLKVGRFEYLPRFLANSRMHEANKTLQFREQVFRESFLVLRRHYGYIPFKWIYSYMLWLRDKRDQFYEPLRPSLAAYVLSLFAGCRHNPTRAFRYVHEWSLAMSAAGAARYWDQIRSSKILGGGRT